MQSIEFGRGWLGRLTDDRRCLALLIVIQLIVTAIVQPRGDFPLNDDWAYAHSVRWLLDEHRIRLSDWIAMNLLPQTVVGAVVTSVFGFSFETLRHLSQTVALLASAAAFYWFRTIGLAASDALIAAVAMIAMPCWPVLANSYMTDLYGLVFALPAAALFIRTLERPSARTLFMAALIASIGVLERQVVIVVPFAFMVAWLWSRRPRSLRTVAIGVGPFAAAMAAEVAYHTYLALGPGVPAAQEYAHGRVFPLFLKIFTGEEGHRAWVVSNIVTMGGYLGLFFAGWGAWWGMRGASRKARVTLLGLAVAIAIVSLATGWLPPYRQNNTMDAAGIGPYTLYDAIPRGIVELDRSPGAIWRVAGIAASFGLAALLTLMSATATHVFRAGRNAASDRVFMVTVLAAYLGPFVITDYLDRYLLFALPFLFALWARTWVNSEAETQRSSVRIRRAGAVIAIIATLGISAAATRDYFSWNRARWDAIRTAEKLGAKPDTLDGGFEYNGFLRFEEKPRRHVPGKSWWWVKDDRYVVAFSPLPGYEEIEILRVPHWLSRSPAQIRLLRRVD